jgi:hypothetical protein
MGSQRVVRVAMWYTETFSDKNVVIRGLKMQINFHLVVGKYVSVPFGGTQKQIWYLKKRLGTPTLDHCSLLSLRNPFGQALDCTIAFLICNFDFIRIGQMVTFKL